MKAIRWKDLSRKVAILIADLAFNHGFVIGAVGALNKRFGFIASVFFDYPASDEYADYYTFGFFRKWVMGWTRPVLSGLIWFKGKLIVKFSLAKSHPDFFASGAEDDLRAFYDHAVKTKERLGASEVTFAGVLPGILFRLSKSRDSARTTSSLVCAAVEKVFMQDGLPADFPIIGIGGAGFVGRAVGEELESNGRRFFVVDKKVKGRETWPAELIGRPVLVINLLADNRSLVEYLPYLCPGSVVVNEAYPPPSADLVSQIKARGARIFHICGAEAELVLPNFPGPYRGNCVIKSIPCCAVPLFLSKKGVNPVLMAI